MWLLGFFACKFFSEFSWRTADILFEQPDEMLGILEAERIGDFTHVQPIVDQIAFRPFYHFLLYVFLGSRLFPV